MSDVPPQNLDAEDSVLGAMLCSKLAIEEVEDELVSGDFYRPSSGSLFNCMMEMFNRDEPVDGPLVIAELDRKQLLDKIGGQARINELIALTSMTSNVVHHARLVREAAVIRRRVEAAKSILHVADNFSGTTDEKAAHMDSIYDASADSDLAADVPRPLDASYAEMIAEFEEVARTGVPLSGAKTGYDGIDDLTGGMWKGELIVLAALSGFGKSLFAQNIAENLADAGQPVAFFSYEMTQREIQQRSMSRRANVSLDKVRSGLMTDDERGRCVEVAGRPERPFIVYEAGGMRPSEIRAKARRLKKRDGLGLVVVDYLQLMQGDKGGRTDTKQEEVASISRDLKLMSLNLDVPILAVSQMNRNSQYRASSRPILADLRDSGAVEQSANVVMFLHSEKKDEATPVTAGDVEVIVEKSRMGRLGSVRLVLIGGRQTFKPVAVAA